MVSTVPWRNTSGRPTRSAGDLELDDPGLEAVMSDLQLRTAATRRSGQLSVLRQLRHVRKRYRFAQSCQGLRERPDSPVAQCAVRDADNPPITSYSQR